MLASFPQADQVGDCVVFNVGNSHRLIGRIRYRTQRVYVLRVLTHAEYDRQKWPDECGCYEPPPVRRNGNNPRGT
jgi:mRNA interferase HigB